MTQEPIFTFRNLEATNTLRDHTRQKLGKLDKYLTKLVGVHVIFHVEHLDHIVEMNLSANGSHYIVSERSGNMYTSIDGAVTKLLSQLRRDRDRKKTHKGK